MKRLLITLLLGHLVIFANYAHAGEFSAKAYGKDAMAACSNLQEELWDEAEKDCRDKGGLHDAEPGRCNVQKASASRFRAKGDIVYTCKADEKKDG